MKFRSKQPKFQPIHYIERKTREIIKEKVPGEIWLRWLYYNPIGNITLESIIIRKLISSTFGRLMDNPNSRRKIKPFIRKMEINQSEFLKDVNSYKSFNDFFYRELKKDARIIDQQTDSVISPADGKLLAFNKVNDKTILNIKGLGYSLSSFLKSEELFNYFNNGSVVIIRLAPVDYHRFHFPVNGYPESVNKIKGKYYSVSPHSTRRKIKTFCHNKREFTILRNDNLENVLIAEIGATLVGSIVQTFKVGECVEKGMEKGYFKFGGSTVLLLFKKDKIKIDEDLLKNSKKGLETKVLMGEKIATIIGSNGGRGEKK